MSAIRKLFLRLSFTAVFICAASASASAEFKLSVNGKDFSEISDAACQEFIALFKTFEQMSADNSELNITIKINRNSVFNQVRSEIEDLKSAGVDLLVKYAGKGIDYLINQGENGWKDLLNAKEEGLKLLEKFGNDGLDYLKQQGAQGWDF